MLQGFVQLLLRQVVHENAAGAVILSSAWPWGCKSTQRKSKLVLLESPSNTERLICSQARQSDLGCLDLQTPHCCKLWRTGSCLSWLSTVAWPFKLLDEMEVQELSKCQSWKLEMMLCIWECYREGVSKCWPFQQNFSYLFILLHHSTAFSDSVLFVEETGTG